MIATEGLVLAGAAAVAGGVVNAIAGGGSLITFPTLVAIGLAPVTANLTNTVALCPGYLGATLAQRRQLAGQGGRAARALPFAALGGAAGAVLLLSTDEYIFDLAVPFLLVFASLLLAAQERLRRWLASRTSPARAAWWAALPVGISAVYGGYFGAGLGVIVLAALAVVLADSLVRINALKQAISLVVNVSAAVVFVGSGRVDWPVAGVMLAGSLAGGAVAGVYFAKLV